MAAKYPITNEFLKVYGSSVVAEQKRYLKLWDKDGGPLEASLSSKPFNNGTTFGVNFYGNEYTSFVDEGVQGSVSKKTRSGKKSRFSYKSKMPPPDAIEQWVKRKGIQFRNNETGRFMKRKTTVFLIVRSIFKYGSDTTNFFTKPIEKSQDEFVIGLEEAIKQDIENNLNNDLK